MIGTQARFIVIERPTIKFIDLENFNEIAIANQIAIFYIQFKKSYKKRSKLTYIHRLKVERLC